MSMIISRTQKAINEALKNNCLNVYIACPAGSDHVFRVIDAKQTGYALMVKKISGRWIEVWEHDALYQG